MGIFFPIWIWEALNFWVFPLIKVSFGAFNLPLWGPLGPTFGKSFIGGGIGYKIGGRRGKTLPQKWPHILWPGGDVFINFTPLWGGPKTLFLGDFFVPPEVFFPLSCWNYIGGHTPTCGFCAPANFFSSERATGGAPP